MELILRSRPQALRGKRLVDTAREWHTRVNENTVEIEQHSVVVSSHRADHDCPRSTTRIL